MFLFTICTKNGYDGDGRKKPKINLIFNYDFNNSKFQIFKSYNFFLIKLKLNKTRRKKSPFWLPSYPPIYDMEANCFQEDQKQVGPSPNGEGDLASGTKRKTCDEGHGEEEVTWITAMIWISNIFQKYGTGVRVRVQKRMGAGKILEANN